MPKDDWDKDKRRHMGEKTIAARDRRYREARDYTRESYVEATEGPRAPVHAVIYSKQQAQTQLSIYKPKEKGGYAREYGVEALKYIDGNRPTVPPLTDLFTNAGIQLSDVACNTSHFSGCTNLQTFIDRVHSDEPFNEGLKNLRSSNDGITVTLTPKQHAQLTEHYRTGPAASR